jgi:carboxyl-terminal processing protease
MMMDSSQRRSWMSVGLAVAVFALPALSVWGTDSVPGLERSPQVVSDRAWSHTVSLVREGDFVTARDTISQVPGPIARRVAGWLDQQIERNQARAQLTQADYDKYVAAAQKWQQRGKIDKALDYALRAYTNTSDHDRFRREAWLAQIRDDAMVKAQSHRQQGEWLDAHALYYVLGEIFEGDKEIQRLRQECLTHARLEEMYKEDTKWEESLENIEPDVVPDALWRIDQKYVDEVDFRELTLAGLKRVHLLVQSPALQKLFEPLRDETRRREFERRLEKRIEQVEESEAINRRSSVFYFNRLLKINEQTIQLPVELIAREFLDASLEELDEFSSVIWPIDNEEFQKHTEGNFVGVGISIRQKYNKDTKCQEIVVVSPLEDTPAYRAGVQADDVIVKVNGTSLCEQDISMNKAVKMITGPEGTSVTLTIRRPSEDREFDLKLVRQMVEIQSVKGYTRDELDPQKWDFWIDEDMGIGYVRLVSFQKNTLPHLRAALNDLQRNGHLRGLILDLRFNPGGLLTSAVQVAELFLGKDEKIVSTKDRRGREWMIPAEQDGPFKDLPLVILVNDFSASASEIVAGAIHDHHRGLIVGERTFGKFSVQNLIQLDRSEAHLKLTTAHYYLPSGKSFHRNEGSKEWGVEPDVAVALVPKEVRKVLEIRHRADVLGPAGQGDLEDELGIFDEAIPPDVSSSGSPGDAHSAEPATKDAADAVDAGTNGQANPDAAANEDEQDEPDPNDRPDDDPQLDTALLQMRVRLLDVDFPVIARSYNSQDPMGSAVSAEEPSASVK